MLIVPDQPLALVTGVTGFLASHVAKHLLEAGFKVRGTARDDEKAKHLVDLFQNESFSIVKIEDMQKEGAFDEAVKDVQFIHHVASPFHVHPEDPYRDLINPAIQGTLNLLKSAHTKGSPRKVIVTSSLAAVFDASHKEGHIFTEDDWNTSDPKYVDDAIKKGEKPDGGRTYAASKSMAEKAAWEYVKNEKCQFQLIVTNPVYIFGPIIHKIKRADEINTSSGIILGIANGSIVTLAPRQRRQNFVDVRDVADAHVKASLEPEAEGKRFILSAGAFSFREVGKIIRSHFPGLNKMAKIEDGVKDELVTDCSSVQAQKILGMEFIGLEKSIVDSVNSIKAYL